MSTRNLDRLFKPRSVALVGASPRPGSLGHAVFTNLRAGLDGALLLVNPRHTEVEGIACVARIADLKQPPDVVVIAAPRETVVALVQEAADLGVPTAIVITADPDHGPDSLKARLGALALATGMRIVGPNCLGVIAPRAKLNASFAAQPVAVGDLAVISQSGAIAAALIAWAHRRKIGFSGLVSVGDMANVNFADLLDYYALDPSTRAILLYVEAIGDAKSFMSAARAAARVKPVIVVKSGRTAKAARAAATHTGALAGADAVYDAAFRRAGLLRVGDIDELFDAAETLSRVKPFPGKRLAILTNGGGIGVLAVDRLIELGGTLAELSPDTMERLDSQLPTTWSHANPVDIVGDADAERFRAALSALLADKSNDAVMVMHCPTALSRSEEAAAAVADTYKAYRATSLSPKPVFAAWLGASEECNRLFEEARIPHYETGAIGGFMHLVHWRENRDALMATPPSLPTDFAPDVARARAIVAQALALGHNWLAPVEISGLLDAYGIPAATARFAATPEDAVRVAAPLIEKYGACVVKILAREVTHKSDVGGVVLDIKSAEAAGDVAREMIARVGKLRPEAHIEGVTLHPMVKKPHARELIAGLAEDPTFGPVVVFGRGGTAVEVINDRALALPPLDLSLARDLIERTRVVRILRHYRDVPAADLDAVALTLVKIAQLSADIPEVREIDLNPLIADADGVIAIDARVAIQALEPGARGGINARFAIAPYPKTLERHVVTRDGTRVFLRPVRPEDEEMYRRFFETSVTSEDLRLRFFAPVKEFSHAFVARLTQLDYGRAYALCALDEDSGEMLGGVRLIYDANLVGGEYAILLRSDIKGRGLGWQLMKAMIEDARAEGLKIVEGQVLVENTSMLAMCEHLGFKICDDPHEHGVKQVTLDLTKPLPF
jgi:acetyltransferase